MLSDLRKLIPFGKPHLWLYIVSFILGLPLAGIQVFTASQLKNILDEIFLKKDVAKLIQLPLMLIGLWTLNGVFRYFHYVTQRLASERSINDLRNAVFSKFISLDVEYYTKSKTGELMSRIVNDIQVLFQGIGTVFDLLREPFVLIGLLSYAVYLNWKLTIITLIVLPIVFAIIDVLGKSLKRYGRKSQEVIGEMSNLMQESFSGIRMIKAFDLDNFMRGRFSFYNKLSLEVATKAIRVEELASPILDFLLICVVSGVIYLGGKTVIDGVMTAGEFFAYLAALGMMQQPIRKLNNCGFKLNVADTAAKRINEIFNQTSQIVEKTNLKKIVEFSKGLQFKNVSFAYEEKPVLENVSLEVQCGQDVALVGQSGSGKSTILHLIPRLYDIKNGEILIDGVDIRDLSIHELRSLISYVSQDVFLFHDTVRANLCLNKTYSDSQIWEALEKAHARDFIDTSRNGLDAIIGERGTKLSGGQRQRLSIARSILKNAPILLLDEATSSLDTQSERIVQEALNDLMKNKTSLIVAHRLSTVMKSKEILVLSEGKIVQRGNHLDLNTKEGMYQNLVKMQTL